MSDAPQSGTNTPGAIISDRHRNPGTMIAQAPRINYTWAGICAIIAFIVFGILVFVLYMDLYGAARNPLISS